MNLLQNQVALITGGSRGIGRSLVLAFVQHGATVVFTYAGNTAKAQETEALCGGKAKGVQADAADFALAQTVVDAVVAEHGRLDCVVNNAGITRDNLLLRMTEAQWDEIMAANLKSVFNYTKAATKTMLKQRSGCFINLSSVVGLNGNAGQSNYAATKAGIIAFTQSVAKELGSRSIRANAIAPGFIATEMTDSLPPAELEKWLGGIALGRAGKPEEVADLALFLASPMAQFITGQTIVIDGGMG
jgi:3-oxoacyl-[acyl-carrier protein] reductase